MKKNIFLLICFLSLMACGESTDNSYLNPDSPQPLVIAVVPASAKPGATLQVQGVGFSPVVNMNIILVAGTSSTATEYSLVPNPSAANGATDQISFVLPSQAQVGATQLQVFVGETPSNAFAFTVESP